MPAEPHVDLAFLDAHKPQYIDYYEELLPRLNPGGVILVDNVLWSGEVINPDNQHEYTQAIREFNDHVANDTRTEAVMVPIADGLTIITHAA
jgi:caffeoyl-CoA O-methyltransferase